MQMNDRPSKRVATSPGDERPSDACIVNGHTGFFNAAAVFWNYLWFDEWIQMRAVSREGRALFDRDCSRLRLSLTATGGQPCPKPDDISRAISGLQARFARLSRVRVYVGETDEDDDHPEVIEQQLLSVFSTISSPSLEKIALAGTIYLTPALASLVAGLAPRELTLQHDYVLSDIRLRHQSDYSALELVQKCLPGLDMLSLRNIGDWPTSSLCALHLGTRLRKLKLDLRHLEVITTTQHTIGCVLRAVSGLRQLQDLSFSCYGVYSFPEEDPEACAINLSPLVALTALTRLFLSIGQCRSHEYSEELEQRSAEVRDSWLAVWQAQRQGLLEAVRGMPNLADLHAAGMQLDVRDLAALTSLTKLHVGGLLLPPPPQPDVLLALLLHPLGDALAPAQAAAAAAALAEPAVQAGPAAAEGGAGPEAAAVVAGLAAGAAGGGQGAGQGDVAPAGMAGLSAAADLASLTGQQRWALPLQLKELLLETSSPSVLASLIAPPSLEYIDTAAGGCGTRCLTFNQLDLGPVAAELQELGIERRLSSRVVASMTAAVELLLRGGVAEGWLIVRSGVGRQYGLDGPLEHLRLGLGSHTRWLATLAPLKLSCLTLDNIQMDAMDVKALTQHLPSLLLLYLDNLAIPPVALYYVAELPLLQYFSFSWRHSYDAFSTWARQEVSIPALLQLGLETPSLKTWTVKVPPPGGFNVLTMATLEVALRRPELSIVLQES